MKKLEKILTIGALSGALFMGGCATGPNYSRMSVDDVGKMNSQITYNQAINQIVEGNSELTSANQDRMVRCLGDNDVKGNTYVNPTAYNQSIGKCVKGKANQDKLVYGAIGAGIDAIKIGGTYFLLRGTAAANGIGKTGGAGGIGPGGAGGAGGGGIVP